MSPSTSSQPLLGLLVGTLVISQTVTVQQTTQALRMGRMTQPNQGFGMQLPGPLPTETQPGPDPTIDPGLMPVETVTGGDDLLESLGQAGHQIMHGGLDGARFPTQGRIAGLMGRR